MSSPEKTMHCPTDETLAAFIDGRLEGEAREKIEEHLAMCDSCHAVWQSAAEFQAAETPANVVTGRFRRGWVYAVPAAAAIALVFFLGRDRLPFGRDDGMPVLIAGAQRLEYRTFESRLSADFPYKSLRRDRGSSDADDEDDDPMADVAHSVRAKATDPRVAAASSLFLRDWNTAVETLEKALIEKTGAPTADAAIAKSTDADLLNDLAVAYFERGSHGRDRRPVDYERAYEAADRAWRLDPKPTTAFNRALAIGKLPIREDAKEAWDEYLKLDSTSPWAKEAQKHRDRFSQPGRSERWESERGSIPAATAAREFPQQYREHIQSNVLLRWSAAVHNGNEVLASENRALLRDAAAVSTDPVISGVAKAVDGDPQALAEALKVFSEAESLYAARSAAASAVLYKQAADLFETQRNPFADVAALRAASAMNLAGDYKGSLLASRDVATRTGSASVRALALRLTGLNELALGRPYESVLTYRQALATFRDLGETDNVSAVHNSLAEAFDYLGDDETASRERYQALVLTAEEGKSARRLVHILNAAGRAAIDRGHHASADLFLRRQVEVAKSRKDEPFVINGLLWRGVLHAKRGFTDGADRLIDEAAARAARLPADRAYREHVLSNVNYVQAVARTTRSAGEKLASVDEALRYANTTANNFRAATLWLERGRLSVALGRRADAEASFRSGVALLSNESATVNSQSFRSRHFDARRELYEEWIRLTLADHDRSDDAFAIADELKSRAFQAGAPVSGLVSPASHAERLRPDQALVVYVVLPEQSAVWSLRQGASTFEIIPVGSEALSASVTRFLHALRTGRRGEAGVLGRVIYRTLIEPVEKSLEGAAEVTFVPDGPLLALPFAALRATSGRPLIDQWLLAMSPSCATYFEPVPARQGERTVLIVGDPEFDSVAFPKLDRLPDAEAEAHVLGRIHRGAVVLTGASATVSRMRDGFASHDLVAYAGHSLFNEARPEDSALLLTPDHDSGILYVSELRELHCRAQLVVLGSCSSALQGSGRATAASLANGVLASGAGAVVGALWDIPDDQARGLMESFHRNLVAGHRPAVALRLAQAASMREGELGWAAFRISGREAAL